MFSLDWHKNYFWVPLFLCPWHFTCDKIILLVFIRCILLKALYFQGPETKIMHACICVCVSYHGRGSLLHTAKDQSLAALPDLVLCIAQPVHQCWHNYRQKNKMDRGRERQRSWVSDESMYEKCSLMCSIYIKYSRNEATHDTEPWVSIRLNCQRQ